MGIHKGYVGRLTIPLSGNASNILASKVLKHARAIILETAETAFTGTISVQSSAEEEAGASAMKDLYDGATAVVVGINRVQQWNVNAGAAVRLRSSGTEAAARVVDLYALLDTT